jgi:spore coat polysaccharide biosynthesis protein SpsF
MRIGIILQARASSSRLPGKVLKPLCGRPMLGWIMDRLSQCRNARPLILATSDQSDDDAVAALAEQMGVAVFRGSLDDVLDRFHGCAQRHGLDAIVRATGDNPFVDAEEIDRLVEFFLAGKLAYASAFPSYGSGLPVGIGAEIFSREALETSWHDGVEPHHREHVNEYIQEHPELFPQATLTALPENTAPDLSFTVDTPEQFTDAETLLAEFLAQKPAGAITTPWLIARARTQR